MNKAIAQMVGTILCLFVFQGTADAAAKIPDGKVRGPLGQAIEPYSKNPSETRPSYACPPPTKLRASCLSVSVPKPSQVAAAGRPKPSYEGSGKSGGFSPADLRSAYNLPSEGGEARTIAITIAFDNPKAEEDLATYRSNYGLPSCTTANGCFKKVNQNGEAENYPAANAEWAVESSLDLDMVSAVCPKCKIILVEADSNDLGDLAVAVETAAGLGANAITNSWATEEFSGSAEFNSSFNNPGTPTLFASGDWGYGVYYPAASPDVIAVGGTSLKKSGNARGWAETAWEGAGSGCSKYQSKPAWQKDPGCANRTLTDVSAISDPATPVSIYNSYGASGWQLVGGTSAATPLLAGVEALSSSAFRAAGPSAFRRAGEGGNLFDPVEGNNGFCADYLCRAEAGYDGPTGWGTPNGTQSLPVAITEAATASSASTAVLHGSINPNGQKTEYHFEYGTTTSYGTTAPIPDQSAGSGSGYVEVSQPVEGLKGKTLYHYRIRATNSGGTYYGGDRTFGTTPPSVTTGAASNIAIYKATANGIVNPEGLATTYWVQYGPGTGTFYSNILPLTVQEIGSGTSNVEVSTELNMGLNSTRGLFAHSSYHYRIVAKNAAGTTYGSDQSFTTLYPKWSLRTLTTPSGGEDKANGVSCTGVRCIAVGSYWDTELQAEVTLAELWDEGEWSPMTTVNPPGLEVGTRYAELRDVSCVSASNCTAVGHYKGSEEVVLPLVETWDGGKWTMTTPPLPSGATSGSLLGVSCASATNCLAVGSYVGGGAENTLAEHWDGSKWTAKTPVTMVGVPAARLSDVSCASTTSCVAAGFYKTSAGVEVALAAQWNGSAWSSSTPVPPSESSNVRLASVSCSASNACTGVGSYQIGLGGNKTLVERWNGSSWTLQSLSPVPDEGELRGVSCPSSTHCTAVGIYYVPEELNHGWQALLAQWNGTAWSNPEIEPFSTSLEEWREGYLNAVWCGGADDCTAVGETLGAAENGFSFIGIFAEQTIKPPAATTEPATAKGNNEADLNGVFNPNGTYTEYCFEYGKTTAYGSEECSGIEGSSSSKDLAATVTVKGLESGVTYHFRIRAENRAGVTYGGDRTFTLPGLPVVTTEAATAVKQTQAVLHASVNPTGLVTTYQFECGKTTAYGMKIPASAKEAGSGIGNVNVSEPIEALEPDTTYHCRVTASNSEGTAYGNDVQFTTLIEWTIESTSNPSSKAQLLDVSCASVRECVAVGAGNTAVPASQRWNGSGWSTLTNPNEGGGELTDVSCARLSLRCLALPASGLKTQELVPWTEGKYVWTIKAASTPAEATSPVLRDISCISEASCIAVGTYLRNGFFPRTLSESWNGEKWSLLTTPFEDVEDEETGEFEANELNAVSCTSSTSCTAIGLIGGEPAALRWNGTAWSTLAAPKAASNASADISCTSGSACVALLGANAQAEHWNGSAWTAATLPTPAGGSSPQLYGVDCALEGECTAIGSYTTGSGLRTLAERWDGSAWAARLPANPAGEPLAATLRGVSCITPSRCRAAGYYEPKAGEQKTLAESYDVDPVSEFQLPSPIVPADIAAGPDGNLWFVSDGSGSNDRVGKMTTSGTTTQYSLPSGGRPWEITAGPDGNLWFTNGGLKKVAKVTTSGTITEYTVGCGPRGIAAGPDGKLWFTCEGKVGKITTSGTVTEYSLSGSGSSAWGITAGPDGNLWFTMKTILNQGKIGKITTSGTITEYPLGSTSFPRGITAGPDGNLWFAVEVTDKIGKITTSGTITQYSLAAGSSPWDLTTGADGNLWFTANSSNNIGKITTSGTITQFPLPVGSAPKGIASGPGGKLWFANEVSGRLGTITP